jgi:hypothetical protein
MEERPDSDRRLALLTAGTVVGLLAAGEYVAVESLTRGRHAGAADLRQA